MFSVSKILQKNKKKEEHMSLLEKLMKAGSDHVKAAVLSESDFFTDRDEIVTEIPALNIALGGSIRSGLQAGLTMVSGASKSFKTCISLYMVAAYMKKYKDAVCIFYDTEFGSTPSYFKNFGIDIDRVLHIPIEQIEQLKFDIVNRLKDVKKKDHVIVFIDSVGNIASKKEVEDAMEEKGAADMTRAKQLKSLWRITTPMFTMRDIPCIAINHIYMEQGGMYPKTIVSGGCLIAGTEIRMADGSVKNVEDIVIGEFVKTLQGDKSVTATWNPETLIDGTPECYRVHFEDGTNVVCSDKHKFLVNDVWVEAKELIEGTDVEVY